MSDKIEIDNILNEIVKSNSNPVVKDCFKVYKECKEVTLNLSGIVECSKKLQSQFNQNKFEFKSWRENTLNPSEANDFALNWIFWIDCMNFSFWSDLEFDRKLGSTKLSQQKYGVEYGGELHQGYWSLCACYNRAIDNGVPLLDPHWLLNASEDDIKSIFYSDYSKVEPYPPLLDERVRVLKETAEALINKFNGSVIELVKKSEGSALKLVELVTSNFPSFKDEFEFKGERVKIHKRAQILVADIWGCFEGESYGKFDDINQITMFADYRVPQALLYFETILYSPELHQKLSQSSEELASGSELELEIRIQSILAVELVRYELVKTNPQTPWNPILIDFYLWGFAKFFKEDLENYPIHRTRSIFY